MHKQVTYILGIVTILLLCPSLLSGQNVKNHSDSVVLKEVADMAYFEDSSRSLSFDDISDKDFILGIPQTPDIQSKYWYRFYIPEQTDKKLLFLYFGNTDFSHVYIPIKGSEKYRFNAVGFMSKSDKIIIASPQFSLLSAETSEVDFSRPFYSNKIITTHWQKKDMKSLPNYFFDDNHTGVMHDMLKIRYDESDALFYIGVVFISFFLFLVNYFISKNKSFLIYGLYLFGVALYYANRQPLLLNFYQDTVPELHFYVNQLSHIANIGCYMWFVFYFLDFKHEFPKAHKFTRNLLLSILAFGILYGLQIILFPYFPYRFLVMDVFRIATMVSSVGILVFIMFQKPDTITKIVFIGSLVLIIGNALSLILGDYIIFLKLMIVEIILFSVVVALRNKQIDNRRIKSRYELEVEKMKTKTMEELDATKTRFYENITYEFRTPLTLILSPVEQRLITQTTSSEEEKKELNLIKRNARHLLNLINQMLDLSKLETQNMQLSIQENYLNPIIQPIISSFQQEIEKKNITFLTEIQNIEKAWFDSDSVEKIIRNLLSNSSKYTPEGGEIKIKSYLKNGYWFFETTNTTNPEIEIDITSLFTRYYRAEEKKVGIGIGLTLVKELVELSQGNITANILTNNDIRITVSLPVESTFFNEEVVENHSQEIREKYDEELTEIIPEENSFPETEVSPTTEQILKMLPKLLIVEDNPDMRLFIASSFTENYQVLEADNGKAGIEMALKHLPDIIVSDVMMPVKSGIDLCNELKFNEQTSHIPIILLTAKAGDKSEIEGLQSGADDYITKPFNSNILKLKIQNLLHSREKLKELYSNTFNLSPELFVTSTEQEFLQRLEKVTKEHITDPELTSEEFSRLMGMSRSQLHKKLHASLGFSTSEFIRSQRLKMAKELLTSQRNISEISYLVGFNTPSYFSKCFKETFGCTPIEFQESIQ